MRVFRGNFANAPTKAAVFEEASGGGNIQDINAACNAPAKTPSAHLDKVTWHTDFFQYEIAAKTTKVVSHTSLAGRVLYYGLSGSSGFVDGSTSPPASGITIAIRGQVRATEITLLTHNLGYVPLFMVAYEGSTLPNGRIIQTQSGGRGRMVSAYADETVVGIREIAWSSNSALSAVSRTYEVLCFRTPSLVSGQPLMSLSAAGLKMGGGKVDASKEYLRRVKAGESSFDFDLDPTTDYDNGGVRVVTGGTTIDDGVYDGSFVGPDFIPVGI